MLTSAPTDACWCSGGETLDPHPPPRTSGKHTRSRAEVWQVVSTSAALFSGVAMLSFTSIVCIAGFGWAHKKHEKVEGNEEKEEK